jgi:hypothetical protein
VKASGSAISSAGSVCDRGRDLFVGLGWFAVIFPILGICLPLAARLVYGTSFPRFDQGVVVGPLPLWAALYTLFVWWIIWSPTEQTTYQACVLPLWKRLRNVRLSPR